jgi:SAM-dependent methyltransferase
LASTVLGIPDHTAKMTLTPTEWHARFLQQAGWTADLRYYLYRQVGIGHARRVFEVGCGTGAILSDLSEQVVGRVFGLDINPDHLSLAQRHANTVPLTLGDALALPFGSDLFDVSLCHFLLLWVNDPLQVVAEMGRVTREGGAVLALAEPDYGGRVDYPPGLAQLGDLQADALLRQGATPRMGRRLAALFLDAGLVEVETGVLGGRWRARPPGEAFETEWAVIRADLDGRVSEERLQAYYELDRAAWARGERIMYVPTFYAMGRVPTP